MHVEGVAAVELRGLALRGEQPLAGEGLEGGRGEGGGQFGDVGAAAHAAQPLLHVAQVARADGEADELRVVRRDAVAGTRVGHRLGGGGGLDDAQLAIHRDAQPHVVHRLAGGELAPADRKGDVLAVDEVALDVVTAVGAAVADDLDGAAMQRLAPCRGFR